MCFSIFVFLCIFYDKHVHFFYDECADSSEPQWDHKLFSWNLEYRNNNSNLILRTTWL